MLIICQSARAFFGYLRAKSRNETLRSLTKTTISRHSQCKFGNTDCLFNSTDRWQWHFHKGEMQVYILTHSQIMDTFTTIKQHCESSGEMKWQTHSHTSLTENPSMHFLRNIWLTWNYICLVWEILDHDFKNLRKTVKTFFMLPDLC